MENRQIILPGTLCYSFLACSIRATCASYLIRVDLITLIKILEQNNSLRSLLLSYVQNENVLKNDSHILDRNGEDAINDGDVTRSDGRHVPACASRHILLNKRC
jgi:hypothetical protein